MCQAIPDTCHNYGVIWPKRYVFLKLPEYSQHLTVFDYLIHCDMLLKQNKFEFHWFIAENTASVKINEYIPDTCHMRQFYE